MARTIVWFRRDLRIADHAPLALAVRRGDVLPVFIFDRALLHHPETAPARVAFMLASLASLDADLRKRGGRLILRSGDPVEILPRLVREAEADGIYAYLDFERIYGRHRDARLSQAMAEAGLKLRWFEPIGAVPDLMPYPDYRDAWFADVRSPIEATPSRINVPPIASEPLPTLDELGLSSTAVTIPEAGTDAARQLLRSFFSENRDRYYWQLSYPIAEATTGLSPYLKFGVISIRECYQTTEAQLKGITDRAVQRTRKQLISRLRWGSGFAQRFRYLPQLELRSLYAVFDDDGWEFDADLYEAWQTGNTGFPIVDAAARSLLATGGWKGLNFRSRAIYSSFLSNLLGMDWRYGALHFMQHLIDGDCPIDHYQWAMQAGVTHCLDKRWTRIYNPQQTAIDRCDPDGLFIKRWLPELRDVPIEKLGQPPKIAGYPSPILDYKQARQRRIETLERQRGSLLNTDNLIPHLAGMPDSWLPFGSELGPFDTRWAEQIGDRSLFPAALDLASLTTEQTKALRTWFVAHVEIQPHRSRSAAQAESSQSGKTNKGSKKRKGYDNPDQLSLFDWDS
jgi:deoxyribodipyrimidine photo-lyase